MLALFRTLEAKYKNGYYYKEGEKLRLRDGYQRIQDIEKCLVLYKILQKPRGCGDRKVYALSDNLGLLSEGDLVRAKAQREDEIRTKAERLGRAHNHEDRLVDYIEIIKEKYNERQRAFLKTAHRPRCRRRNVGEKQALSG